MILLERVAALVRVRLQGEPLAGRSSAERRVRVREEALAVLREERAVLPARELAELVARVSDELMGLGPIEHLLRDPEVSEVMVNGPGAVYVERKGRLESVGGGLFEGEEAVYHLIERVVGPLGLRADESCPYVDARLPDGSRFHAIIPPLSLCGPVVTVRKFAPSPYGPEDLLRLGTLEEPILDVLETCVRGRANVLISGGAGSGKTTLLGVLSSFIPRGERIVTIEDAAELRLHARHVVRLEARPPSAEGAGGVTVRDLVRNALRMRPDRIIVGEVRGGEALDMLQAMNTGHEGSMSTAHANSPQELMARLETMALMADVVLPADHLREHIAQTVDLVVHMVRLPGGRRVVARVTSVEGPVGGRPLLRDAFRFGGANTGWEATANPGIAHLLRSTGDDGLEVLGISPNGRRG